MRGMNSVQDGLWYFPLVFILVVIPVLPTGGLLGQRLGNPRCDRMLENLELHANKILLRRFSVRIHLQAIVSLAHYIELEIPQRDTHSLSSQSGGVEQKVPTT